MPNTTQTPNVFFDSMLKTLKGEAEVKIVCAVIRQTYGWWEKSFEMSLADLCEVTGVARANVQRAAIRLAAATDDRPAILGRKKKGKGQYAAYSYSLLVDGKDKLFPRGHESSTPEAMNRVPSEAMNHGPSKEETNSFKLISKTKRLSSSPVPNMSSAEKTQDDESKALTQVVFWFEELSKGSAWNWNRDGKAYDQVKHLAPGFILMGICYSVSKCPTHKLSTFAYCLTSIREHSEALRIMPDDEVLRLALAHRQKTLKMAKLGKWTVPEMTSEEYKSVMRESHAGD